MAYPTELIAMAEYEMKVFERVSQSTAQKLIDEVKSLRIKVENFKKLKIAEYFPGDTKPRLTQDEIQNRLQAFWDSNEQDWTVFDDIPESQRVNVMYPHRIRTFNLSKVDKND